MPYELPSLPYAYDALEPTIDAQTMQIHHGKHHQAYVDNLNKALEGTEWDGKPIEQVLGVLDALPEDKQAAGPQQRRRPRESLAVLADHEAGRRRRPVRTAGRRDRRHVRRRRSVALSAERRRRQAFRLRLDVARLGRHRALRRTRPRTRTVPGCRTTCRSSGSTSGSTRITCATRIGARTISAPGGTSSTGTRSHAATTKRADGDGDGPHALLACGPSSR